ncbi:MAG: DEAD/DEAH box helicase [bacterium]
MNSGTVKWFDDDKGFGFIERDSGEDAFVHYSSILDDGYKSLDSGDEVKFEVETTDDGLAAVEVQLINGSDDSSQQSDSQQNGSDPVAEEDTAGTKTFESFDELDLDPRILEAIRDAGFESPRPVQQKAIEPILEGKDLVGTAPTGTGKTAAFLIPILNNLADTSTGEAQALILAPTHELADQITEEARTLGANLDLVVRSVYGGTDIYDEMDQLKETVDILVACPGRLLDHLGRGTVNLSDIKYTVLDESDRMCDMGFLPDVKRIIRKTPENHQKMFFSATIPPEIQKLADKMLDNPVKISVGRQAPTKTISHYVCRLKQHQKKKALKTILSEHDTESVLVFCRTRKTVRQLANYLREREFDACPLEGSMGSIGRQATISGFRNENFKILIATNVAARGLDVDHISHVINYDIPEDPDVYTHRIGRTGRSGSSGKAFTFVTDKDRQSRESIERTIGYEIDEYSLEGL